MTVWLLTTWACGGVGVAFIARMCGVPDAFVAVLSEGVHTSSRSKSKPERSRGIKRIVPRYWIIIINNKSAASLYILYSIQLNHL